VQAFGTYSSVEREPSSLVLSRCQADVFPGSEIYVGCSNGEVLLFALQAKGPDQVRSRHCTRSFLHRSDSTQPETYTLVSRQMLPTGKAVDEIVLAPSISKALVLSGKNVCS
jgi:vacuolar protein sorting-associated protein 3